MRAGRPSLVLSQSNTGKIWRQSLKPEARGGSRQRASGGAATLLSSRQLGLLPGERNSKIAASATAMIGRGVEIVKYGSMLSPLSTAAERPTVAVIYHREETRGQLTVDEI
jgi:hypothetical protein